MTTTQTIDFASEPPTTGWDQPTPQAWLDWRNAQWGECSCCEIDPDHIPFDDHFPDCPHEVWRTAYKTHKAKEVKVVPMGDTLESYLTPLTEVNDLATLAAAFQRNDGATLLPEGKLSALHGMPSIGKSFVALEIVRAVAKRGGRVLWWDFEDTAETLRGRCDDLGFTDADGLGNVYFALASMAEDEAALKQAALFVTQGTVTGLVIIDAVNSAGCPSDGADVAPWFKSHIEPFGKDTTVLMLDHIPKRSDDRAPGAIGSTHKRSVLTGVSLLVEGKAWTRSEAGRVTLRNHKDRHGVLPAGLGKVVAAITGEYKDGTLTLDAIEPNVREDGGEIADRIIEALTAAGDDGIRGKGIMRKRVAGKAANVDAALLEMASEGVIEVAKDGAAMVYRLARGKE